MLSNLYALKQKCKREETFFDKVHVIGIEFFGVSVSLSCYWATRTEAGHVKYLAKTLDTWCLLTKSETSCKEARTCIHNAIDWLLFETQAWIHSDLQAVEDTLVDVPLAGLMASIYSERSREGMAHQRPFHNNEYIISMSHQIRPQAGQIFFLFHQVNTYLSIEAGQIKYSMRVEQGSVCLYIRR